MKRPHIWVCEVFFEEMHMPRSTKGCGAVHPWIPWRETMGLWKIGNASRLFFRTPERILSSPVFFIPVPGCLHTTLVGFAGSSMCASEQSLGLCLLAVWLGIALLIPSWPHVMPVPWISQLREIWFVLGQMRLPFFFTACLKPAASLRGAKAWHCQRAQSDFPMWSWSAVRLENCWTARVNQELWRSDLGEW